MCICIYNIYIYIYVVNCSIVNSSDAMGRLLYTQHDTTTAFPLYPWSKLSPEPKTWFALSICLEDWWSMPWQAQNEGVSPLKTHRLMFHAHFHRFLGWRRFSTVFPLRKTPDRFINHDGLARLCVPLSFLLKHPHVNCSWPQSNCRFWWCYDHPQWMGIIPESVWAKGSSNSGGLSNIFTSSHLLIFSSSHFHILTSSHFHISHLHIFSSSHPHILTSSHPHIFTSSHLHIFSSSHHIFTSPHLRIFTSSHPHIFTSHIFTSSHLHILKSSHPRIFTSSHLLIFSSSHHFFTSSHLHIFSSSHRLIFTSSHPHIFSSSHLLIFTSSHLHIFTSSHLHIFTFSLALLLSCPLALSFFSISLLRRGAVPTRDTKRNPFARNDVRSPKTEVKLRFWVCRDNPFARNEVRSPKTEVKFGFEVSTTTLSHEIRFDRQKLSKIAILKCPRQPFRTKRGSIAKNWSKIAILKCRSQPFRTKWRSIAKNWSKIAILQCRSQPFRTKRALIVENWSKMVLFLWQHGIASVCKSFCVCKSVCV